MTRLLLNYFDRGGSKPHTCEQCLGSEFELSASRKTNVFNSRDQEDFWNTSSTFFHPLIENLTPFVFLAAHSDLLCPYFLIIKVGPRLVLG